MSNSGRIGGKKHSVTQSMSTSKFNPIALVPDEDKSRNRAHRRAYAAMARKNKDKLVEVSQLAVLAHLGKTDEAKAWMYEKSEEFGGDSPLEWVLMGRGDKVVSYLKKAMEP